MKPGYSGFEARKPNPLKWKKPGSGLLLNLLSNFLRYKVNRCYCYFRNQFKKFRAKIPRSKRWKFAIISVIVQFHTNIMPNNVNAAAVVATKNDDITSSSATMNFNSDNDLKNHRNFEIKYAPRDKGRHVIAKNDMTEGEIVLVEPVPLLSTHAAFCSTRGIVG